MISIQYSEDPKERKVQKIALWTVVGLAGAIVFGLLFGLLIQFLWNATLTEMFDLPALSFWQAVGLFILAKLFFGFGAGSSGSSRKRKKPRADRQPSADAADVSTLADDETFKKFWQEEGKASYEAFQIGDSIDPDSS
jgi:hypothetical protein